MSALMKIILIVILVVFLVIVGPWLFIWAVNLLAAAGGASFVIPFDFWTWLATMVFIMLVRGSKS